MKRTDRPGWKTVSISAETRRLLEQLALYELLGGVPRADGRYDIQLDDEVIARLQQIDPDIDKAIKDLCQPRH